MSGLSLGGLDFTTKGEIFQMGKNVVDSFPIGDMINLDKFPIEKCGEVNHEPLD
jgi:hypothetical protein